MQPQSGREDYSNSRPDGRCSTQPTHAVTSRLATLALTPASQTALALAASFAAATPTLLAWNIAPSPTFLNQALAVALWGLFVVVGLVYAPQVIRRSTNTRVTQPLIWRLQAAFAVLGLAALWSWWSGALPSTLALSALALLAAAAVAAAAGASPVSSPAGHQAFKWFCWGWLLAGLLNAGIAAVQVFAPEWADGRWIAITTMAGRAIGNLRQPNHLSSVLLWACVAVVALLELRQLARGLAAAALVALVLAVVMTASRTGLLSVGLLALWGLTDRKLARSTRLLLLLTPVMYGMAWWGLSQWAAVSQSTFGGAQRLAETDISGSRFGIWANSLKLIEMHPWAGVGFGNFNFAWTLTPFPGRPTAFFDHAHNLPIHLAVELGLPIAALVLGLLLWALVKAARQAWRAMGDDSSTQRCALMMVLMIGLHSLLEYPLWYAYFLLPTAWALGVALGGGANAATVSTPAKPWLALLGGLLAAGAVFSVWDYYRVARIYSAAPSALSLAQRIESGQRSVFFGHHADYAAVTAGRAATDPRFEFDRASHYLLDTRLMMAWAQSFADSGDADSARYLAARLREFGKEETQAFFAACPKEALAAAGNPSLPFQCTLPERALTWKDFLAR
jgi:O-antigen ligase